MTVAGPQGMTVMGLRPPLPSFPRKRESRIVLPKTSILPIRHFWIPACAGRTVGEGVAPPTTINFPKPAAVFLATPESRRLQ